MACFERNCHTSISSGDSILSTIFCGDHAVDITFCSMTHYDITIGNDFAKDMHCDIMDQEVIFTYDIIMNTDFARTLIYYVLLRPIMINVYYVFMRQFCCQYMWSTYMPY